MASKSYELHHHFPKLAEESGFTFNVHRPRLRVDWNKIRLIDIDSIIKEKRFEVIEQHLNDILNCVFESEFDVRILDEGVLKMFRLAQLAVEYQHFCRHYLDRSVYVLREEITNLAQELDTVKKAYRDKEEELRKQKRKTKHPYRTQLPYGNENIATMILKTLSNKSDIFPTTSNADTLQYNKCSYCDKVFLNQLYLKSHLARRHTNAVNIPQRDVDDDVHNNSNDDNSKLNVEINELKIKLKEMEDLLTRVKAERDSVIPDKKIEPEIKIQNENSGKQMKDAEVTVNNDVNLLDKIEEWKKEEHEKYNKEINSLRNQIEEIVNSFKPKENKIVQNEYDLVQQLHTTIQQQGIEIHALKQELDNAKIKTNNEEMERKKERDAEMALWIKRAENQTLQYEALLQKLNEVAQEAVTARAQAETERNRASHLQVLLKESLNKPEEQRVNKPEANKNDKSKNINNIFYEKQNGDIRNKDLKRKPHKTDTIDNTMTLENLHKKAQELLNMASSYSSDDSDTNREVDQTATHVSPKGPKIAELKKNHVNHEGIYEISHNKRRIKNKETLNKKKMHTSKASKNNNLKLKKETSNSQSKITDQISNGTAILPGSPLKLVRSKISEEVNNRLVNIGVDPLKSRLSKLSFQKQKVLLQQQCEHKSKRNPEYQKVKHSILAYLDSTTPDGKKDLSQIEDYVTPNKSQKSFSFASVISNVKNKALSLMKSNDSNVNFIRKEVDDDITKKALMLLKTPPSSASTTPDKNSKLSDNKLLLSDGKSRRQVKRSSATLAEEGRKVDTRKQAKRKIGYSDNDSTGTESDHKYYDPTTVQGAKLIENLVKSPARRPASATAHYNASYHKSNTDKTEVFLRSQSATNVAEYKDLETKPAKSKIDDSSDEVSSVENPFDKPEAISNQPKQTKGVLKNASSTSSLNKKKVLFDMEAIQMKSVSASPSQSVTEKSDNEKFELGLVNLDGEEWDISSIEDEPLKKDTKIHVANRTSSKIAELRTSIESQLARRYDSPSTALVGGINLLPTMVRASSIGGSNTSLGSSILDDPEVPALNHKTFVKPKKVAEKDDSEIDISEYSLEEGKSNKKRIDSF